MSDPIDLKKTEPEKKEIKLSKLGLFISVFFATLGTFIITAARLPAGVIAYIAMGALNIVRNITGFMLATIIDLPYLSLRAIASLVASLILLPQVLRRLLAITVSILAVGLNVLLQLQGYIAAFIFTALFVMRQMLSAAAGSLGLVFHALLEFRKIIYAVINLGLGIVGNLLSLVIGVAYVGANALRQLSGLLAAMVFAISFVGRQTISILVGLLALGFNALSEIARVGYGLLQLSFHSLRKIIGIALGVLFVGLNTISHALNLLFVAASTFVRALRPLIGFIIASLVVMFQGIRNVLAGIIALPLAIVVGVFAGVQNGIDAFNAIYNFLHVEDKLTDIFSQIFKKLNEEKSVSEVFTHLKNKFREDYDIIGKHLSFSAAFKLGSHTIGGQWTNHVKQLTHILKNLDKPKDYWQGFKNVQNALNGDWRWANFLPKFHNIRVRVGGQLSYRERFRAGYELMGEKWQAYWQDFTQKISQLDKPQDYFKIFKTIRKDINDDWTFDRFIQKFNQVQINFGNETYPSHKVLFDEVRQKFEPNPQALSQRFTQEVNDLMSDSSWLFSSRFQTINRHWIFGDAPWLEQTVAANAFRKTSGYKTEDGLQTIPNKIEEDFNTSRKYTDGVYAGSTMFLVGVGMSLGLILVYPFKGIVAGGINSGVIGAVKGGFVGLWDALTFAFRNTHKNQENNNFKINRSFFSHSWDLVTDDWQALSDVECHVFGAAEEKSDSADNVVVLPVEQKDESVVNEENTHHYGSLYTEPSSVQDAAMSQGSVVFN